MTADPASSSSSSTRFPSRSRRRPRRRSSAGDRPCRAAIRAAGASSIPRSCRKLQRLDLIARLVVEGFLTGLHKSPYHGFSVEFAEHRQYMPGDPIRHVDWKVYAKSDRFYIKQYEEETNLRALPPARRLQLDALRATRGGSTKLQYGDLSGRRARLPDAPAAGRGRAAHLLRPRSTGSSRRAARGRTCACSSASWSRAARRARDRSRRSRGTTDVGPCLEQLAERMPRRGLIILISDLWDATPERVLRALEALPPPAARGGGLPPASIRAKSEFPFREETVFIDMETGERLSVQPWEIRRSTGSGSRSGSTSTSASARRTGSTTSGSSPTRPTTWRSCATSRSGSGCTRAGASRDDLPQLHLALARRGPLAAALPILIHLFRRRSAARGPLPVARVPAGGHPGEGAPDPAAPVAAAGAARADHRVLRAGDEAARPCTRAARSDAAAPPWRSCSTTASACRRAIPRRAACPSAGAADRATRPCPRREPSSRRRSAAPARSSA